VDIEIHAAAASDAAELTALAVRAKAHWGYPDEWLAAWRDDLALTPDYIARNLTLAARCDGRIVGTATLQRAGAAWSLEHVWIDPAFHRRGIGRRLVQRALEAAWGEGAPAVEVHADPFAEPFYRRLGARRVGAVPAPMPGAPERTLPHLEFRR
jgi:predicted N-acetyltransferase YhbS